MYQQRARSQGPGSLSRQVADLAPGKRTLTERLPAAPDVASVQRAAAHGVRGPAQPLPHLDRIQALFGRHDVNAIQAHVGGAAAEGAAQMGAQAYATGNSVAFRDTPDLHTAAHEAAHVVQQRGGVQLKGGVGQVGDAYEQHADAVADLVLQGRSAESLLDRHAGGAAAPSTGAVQRYDSLHDLYADVKAQIGPAPDGDWEAEWKLASGKLTNPFATFTFDDVVAAIRALREERRVEQERPKVDLEKRKDVSGEVFAMYQAEIQRTGTRAALSAVLTTPHADRGVFLSTRLAECNSMEHGDIFVAQWHVLALPDLTRLEHFDSAPDNKLDKEANCRLVAEHELVHLKHSWENGKRGDTTASTYVDEFFGQQLHDTIAELKTMVPDHGKPARHLHERLDYVESRSRTTGKNNEAPAVMRELRRYLEALVAEQKIGQSYQPIFDRIVELDERCTAELKRPSGPSVGNVGNVGDVGDPNCCPLF